MKKFGNKTGVGYGKDARRERTKSRIDKLSKKLRPDSKSPFGNSRSKRSGYGDKGSDVIKSFTDKKIKRKRK